ncbi:hypothetical protein B0H13DRAFT_1858977 [Mycena leptocephala]|nr:hypothetical protein B0H13DRAFT_1858977 [Mycena leptocephala]
MTALEFAFIALFLLGMDTITGLLPRAASMMLLALSIIAAELLLYCPQHKEKLGLSFSANNADALWLSNLLAVYCARPELMAFEGYTPKVEIENEQICQSLQYSPSLCLTSAVMDFETKTKKYCIQSPHQPSPMPSGILMTITSLPSGRPQKMLCVTFIVEEDGKNGAIFVDRDAPSYETIGYIVDQLEDIPHPIYGSILRSIVANLLKLIIPAAGRLTFRLRRARDPTFTTAAADWVIAEGGDRSDFNVTTAVHPTA